MARSEELTRIPLSFISKVFPILVVLACCSCSGQRPSGEYGYVFHESTGQNEYILISSQEVPFHFDEQNSNKLALDSLRSLSARVVYPNCKGDKIFLVGEYDSQSQMFVLRHWYIKVPFTEITLEDRIQMPEEIRTIERGTLERTDFVSYRQFNPNSGEFNPKDFQRKSN